MPRSTTITTQKAALKDALLTPTFLMCAPDYFDPSLEAHGGKKGNEFMGKKVDPDVARAQWNTFKSKIEELGGKVLLVAPQQGMLDQVYTADPAAFHSNITFTPDGKEIERVHVKSLRSKFTNLGRQKELSAHFQAACTFTQSLRDAAMHTATTIGVSHETAQFNTEGSGDNVYDTYRGIWWSGYVANPNDPNNGRSDIKSHAQLANLTGRDVLSLEVMRPYFHIDTSHTPLPRGHVLSFASGIRRHSYDTMRKTALHDFGLPEDDYLIEVDASDAAAFACNLTVFDDRNLIVTHDISDPLADTLSRAGYTLHLLDYSEIRKGGGLFHCTANRVNMIGPKGGTANDPDFYNRIEAALS